MSSSAAIDLPAGLALAIREHARAAYPHEACGFLVGVRTADAGGPRLGVREVVPAENTRRDRPRDRFAIDPAAFVRVQRDADRRGLDVLGFYHSHPDAPATPSRRDRAGAWPGYAYVVVAVRGGEPAELTAAVLRAVDDVPGAGAGAGDARPAEIAGGATLSDAEQRRYGRHLVLPEVGREGQERLKDARVLLVGVGGLGSPLALYLAAAGVGTLGLVDADVVDETNLQRQVLHGTADVGRPKLDSATDRIRDVNPHVRVERHETMLDSTNALRLFADYDVIADGTDNFPTRYLVNDACVLTGKPNVYGSVFRFEGQASVFAAPEGPCYRCLYPDPPPPGLVPSCAEGGVLGILPGIIGLVQANEVVKWILGLGEPLVGRLLLFDALAMSFRELRLRRDPACPVCGAAPSITRLVDYEAFCGLPSAGAQAAAGAAAGAIAPAALAARLARGDAPFILDVREPHEHAMRNIPGAVLVPLGQVAARAGELPAAGDIVVHCKSGKRSAQAIALLVAAGVEPSRLLDLAGGIDAWPPDAAAGRSA